MSLKKLFKANVDGTYTRFSMEDFLKDLEANANDMGSPLSAGKGLVGSISTESFGEQVAVSQEAHSIYQQIQATAKKYGIEAHAGKEAVIDNQLTAAAMAAIASADTATYVKALRRVSKEDISSDENIINVRHDFAGPAGSIDAFSETIGLENYNEKSQRDFRVITVGYNLASSKQDEFAERIYPTTVVNPIEGGVIQVLPYIAIMKDVYHSVSGQKLDNQEINMVEAYRDPSILNDESTDLIPAIDPGGSNAKFFVDPALALEETIVTDQGLSITTAPLKPGVKLDLIGNSNANLLINKGMLDVSDTIDPAGRLRALYVMFEGKVVKFTTERLARAVMQPDLIGDTRGAKVEFFSDDMVVSGDSKATDQSTTSVIDELGNRGWTLHLSLSFTTHISLSRGDSRSSAGEVIVDRVLDESRRQVDLTQGAGKDLVDALADLEVVGYELALRFTNTNRRQRGHLLQTRSLQFRHPIPVHAPVTLPMSTLDEQGPGDVVHALTTNTNMRSSNNAVTRLLNYAAQLKEVTANGFDRPGFGAVEGALSAIMRPTYRYAEINLPKDIDTLKSQDRWEDICSTIMNKVKGELFPAYRESNIEAAFRVVSGNQDERPMFLLCADKEIANYLMTRGEERLLGPYIEYDIVSTNNELFDGKLLVIPTRKNPQEDDILNFGQFFYVPTIVADLPITRTGQQVSREIAAFPFNLHVNNIPFVLEFDVVGLQEVMGNSQWNEPMITKP